MSTILFFLSILQLLLIILTLLKFIINAPSYLKEGVDENVAPSNLYNVSVIIPARNEEKNIERCVKTLLSQNYPKKMLEIIVIDDNSTDKTSEIVKEIIKNNPNVKLIQAPELPKNWCGKPHACWIGANASSGDMLFFLDADTYSEPSLINSGISYLETNKLDFLSLLPKFVLSTFSEKLFMPIQFFNVFLGFSFKKMNDQKDTNTIAAGACMLIKRDVYFASNGHKSVANFIQEDVEYVRILKKLNYKVNMINADKIISVRMYENFISIWQGFSKSGSSLFGNYYRVAYIASLTLLSVILSVALPVLTMYNNFYLQPIFSIEFISFVIAIIQLIVYVAFQILFLKTLKVPIIYCALYPIGYFVVSMLMFNSIRVSKIKRKKWKGRIYNVER